MSVEKATRRFGAPQHAERRRRRLTELAEKVGEESRRKRDGVVYLAVDTLVTLNGAPIKTLAEAHAPLYNDVTVPAAV